MKYLILTYSNPASRELWETLSGAQRAEAVEVYAALNEDLASSGELIESEALDDPSLATRVWVREGRTIINDGPFLEAKVQVAGFLLVDCESRARAIAIAARVPEAIIGLVEVRPVLDLTQLKL